MADSKGGTALSLVTGRSGSCTDLNTTKKSGTLSLTAASKANIPWHLSTTSLTRRRKLPSSSGNLHGYMAEDYSILNWPLPKMFGPEKYAHTLVDIEDPRHTEKCAEMSRELIRLNYDEQIIDLEWRKTYKALLDAEHRLATLPGNCQEKTKKLLETEVKGKKDYLLELQEQRDLYKSRIKEIYDRCSGIKSDIKKERDLDELRHMMSHRIRGRIDENDVFWRTKFNPRSSEIRRSSMDEFDI